MLVMWIIICLAAILIELLTPTALLTIWFAGGSIIALILEICNCSVFIQVVAFLVVSLVMMLVVRPVATRYLRGNVVPTNADRVIGAIGRVTKPIEADSWGEVYVNSTYWSAVEVNNHVVEKGKQVKVLAIEGAKLIVKEI